MASHSSTREIPFGAAKLCQDIAVLINNHQGSDVQFKVGGGVSTQENGETIYDQSATVTLYAHSLILRCRSPYFVTLLDNDKDWKEKSKCVIYKPNILPSTLQDILRYIYTGDVRANRSDNIIELIMVANEMGLDELSTKCQSEFIRTVRHIFSGEGGSTKERIPVDVAIRTHIIPVLNLASNNSLSNLSQELLTVLFPHMSVITKSPDAYTELINEASLEALVKIISSDDLALTERSICDLVIDWACCQTKLSKAAIETRLCNLDDDEEEEEEELSDDRTVVSRAQLKQFKKFLTPLLPAIRFSLLDPDEYRSMVNTLSYILPRRHYLEINEYFLNPNCTGPLDAPRKMPVKQKTRSTIVVGLKIIVESKIIVETTVWELLRKNIFETGGIAGCNSSNDLKFEFLFRASQHGFRASTFHQRCDYKGPTLLIARSDDGHLFGGVNFNHWKSDCTFSSSILNFLFALPDERYRKDLAIFRIQKAHAQYSSCNHPEYGPAFGRSLRDLTISDSANTNQGSNSYLPNYYDGNGASNTALAGSWCFALSDYEVFGISTYI